VDGLLGLSVTPGGMRMGSGLSKPNGSGEARDPLGFSTAWQTALVLTILVLFWALASLCFFWLCGFLRSS
jgi:hypothetical protein